MTSQLQPWLPDLVVAGGVVLLFVLSRSASLRSRTADLVLLVAACSAAAAVVPMNVLPTTAAGGAIVVDPWSTFLRFALATIAMTVAWLATRTDARESPGARGRGNAGADASAVDAGEVPAVWDAGASADGVVNDARSWAFFLAALLGTYLVVSAAHAATAVAGLELAWIGTALWISSLGLRASGRGAVVAMLLESAAATACLVFGFALLFGVGAELGWTPLGRGLAASIEAPGAHAAIFAGVTLVFAGGCARAALVPWHGARAGLVARAPLPACVWLQVGLPIATVAMLARFVRTALVVAVHDGRWQGLPGVAWPSLLALVATSTVAVGHVAALRERDVKRLFGWFATAQVGYLAAGLAAGGEAGLPALLFHAVAVVAMTAGAMTAVAPVVEIAGSQEFEVLRGLARRGAGASLAAACLVVFVLSFAAVPGTAGYEGRARLLSAVIGGGGTWTALALAAASLVGVVAGVRVLVTLFDRPPGGAGRVPADFEAALLAVLLAAATLAIGLAPSPLAALAERSATFHVAAEAR